MKLIPVDLDDTNEGDIVYFVEDDIISTYRLTGHDLREEGGTYREWYSEPDHSFFDMCPDDPEGEPYILDSNNQL